MPRLTRAVPVTGVSLVPVLPVGSLPRTCGNPRAAREAPESGKVAPRPPSPVGDGALRRPGNACLRTTQMRWTTVTVAATASAQSATS